MLAGRRVRDFARRFPENGMKLLLEDPRNVQDLLRLTGTEQEPGRAPAVAREGR
jgi:hypothetical protein